MKMTFTSTHMVLFNMDILPQIIEHLFPRQFRDPHTGDTYVVTDQETQHAPRHCARLAAVCKSFTDPALDALWKTQYSFHSIFALIPELKYYSISKQPPVCHSCS